MFEVSGIAAGFLALSLAGGAFAHDEGDKISQTLDLSGFDKIKISGVYELDVRVGPEFSIELTGYEDEMERVEASVRNGELHLGHEKGSWRTRHKDNDDHGVEAVITMPSLTGLKVSGVVDGRIAGVDVERFDIQLSGVGDIHITGECGALDAQVSGVGDLDARELECRMADVQVSGVGSAAVFAREEVDANISGMGDIDVFGSPNRVNKSSGMFADITVH
ncbi:head GIN domain-containing protein [Hyphococcus sp.]|uniref:head GIN domain-containing protein n=1 Tax=Hyphococcus sp. TaxID=2038636 RepID=UPI003CCBFA37